jgi:uncharacterized membrane protein HdeD (DUF308 family)
MASAAAETSTVSDLAKHNWGWVMVRGVLAILLGNKAILRPFSALFAFSLDFAAYCFVDGIASLMAGIRGAQAGKSWGALVFRGVTGILIGVLFVVLPMIATATYAFLSVLMLAIWSVITGLFEIMAAVRLRKEMVGEWLLGLSGAISVLLGIGIVALVLPSPRATILSAAWLIAIYAFIVGVALVGQAIRLKGKAA